MNESQPTAGGVYAPTFEQVLEAYLLRREDATGDARDRALAARQTLGEFMRRYPQFTDQLMNYAATASVVETSSAPELEATETNAVVRQGMEIAARLIAARRVSPLAGAAELAAAQNKSKPFVSLRKAAEACGLTMQGLAAETNLSVPLLMKLDRRLIRFASIPSAAMERIGVALEQSAEAIADYLQGDAQFATNAHFRADEAPQMPDQQDFFEAIEKDLTMQAEQKRAWLMLKDEG